MNHQFKPIGNDPLQPALQNMAFHPGNSFIEFKKEEIEQSVPDRFENMVRMYPDRLAVKTIDCWYSQQYSGIQGGRMHQLLNLFPEKVICPFPSFSGASKHRTNP